VNELKAFAQLKRRFFLYLAALLAVATLINGFIYGQLRETQQENRARIIDIETAFNQQKRQTLSSAANGGTNCAAPSSSSRAGKPTRMPSPFGAPSSR
jgi:hypothetical protein